MLEEGEAGSRLCSEALLPRFANSKKAPAVTRNAPTVPKSQMKKFLILASNYCVADGDLVEVVEIFDQGIRRRGVNL